MRTILRTEDFSCPSCVTRIETNLEQVDGVKHAKVHFNTGRIEVHHDAGLVTVKSLMERVQELGYDSRPSPF